MKKKTEKTKPEGQEQGRELLTAVERILDDTAGLVALADRYLEEARRTSPAGGPEIREAAAQAAISRFSNLSAVAGGAAALPGLFPGVGTLVALTGGALADMGLMLKFEVEMALVLTHLHGFDIAQPEERQLAFLLASVGTYDAKSGGNFLVDVAKAEGVAVWNYAPRQVSKLLLAVLAKIALLQLSKGLVRALPVVGVVVGSAVNKVLTRRVGARCLRDLKLRRELADRGEDVDEVVDARVRGPR